MRTKIAQKKNIWNQSLIGQELTVKTDQYRIKKIALFKILGYIFGIDFAHCNNHEKSWKHRIDASYENWRGSNY